MAQLGIGNIGIGQTAAALYNDKAYAGLKYGLGPDLVVSLVYRQTDTITPGLVLAILPDATGALPSVAAAAGPVLAAGIFVKDATLPVAPDALFFPSGLQLPAVLSIMQRGSIWAQLTAGGTCTVDGLVKFAADGTVSDTGAYALPHAVFASAPVTLTDGSRIAAVELHSPLAN